MICSFTTLKIYNLTKILRINYLCIKFQNKMKVKFTIVFMMLFSTLAFARGEVYCINACPGENANSQINVSWAADTTLTDSYLLVCEDGKKPVAYYPTQYVCNDFYDLPSASPAGEKIRETPRFLHCKVSLSGLKADTGYSYVICSGTAKKVNSLRSAKGQLCEERHFKTAGADEWSACIISDFHSYTPLPKRLEGAMAMVNTVKEYDPAVDWVLNLGDVCAWGGSHSFWRELYRQDNYKNCIWAGVNGNHDNMSRGYEKQSHAFFRENAAYPQNGYGDQQGVCYWFRYGQVLFVMLNNEAMHDYMGLHDAQNWVRKVITDQKNSSNPPVYTVVCEHYEWFYPNGAFLQYKRWHELFDQLGVDLALSGNSHIYVRSLPVYDGKVTDGSCGTVYLQTSSSDNERGRTIKDEPLQNSDKVAFRFTEGSHTISALDLKVNDSKMTLTLLDRNGKVLDSAEVMAKKDKKYKEDVLATFLRDSLEAVSERCAGTLKAAYMAEKYLGTRYNVPGWEGFPVEHYEYYTGVDINAKVQKRGTVLMLNPSAEKLAKWIITAVYDATGAIRYEDLEKVRKFITWQSGAQFPVKGVVYEAMYTPGDYYPYIFKDGVTVYMADEARHKAQDQHPSDELLDFYTDTMSNEHLKDYTGRYARISSTTREMYYKAGGKDKVGKSDDGQRDTAWLATVAKNYQRAWKSDRNFLIYAWALSNLE